MSERGPRAGWTYGGAGSLLWILILGGVLAAKGHVGKSLICLSLFAAGAAYLSYFSPWKRADTPLWKLYSGFVLLLCGSCLAVYFTVRGVVAGDEQLSPWMLFLLLPLFLPIFGFGRKTWRDLHGGH